MAFKQIFGTKYQYDEAIISNLQSLRSELESLREQARLSPEVLRNLRQYFRVVTVYNSNAIEGNQLSIGETRLVIEQGFTITGVPLKDSLEARNLAFALDMFENLADRDGLPILGIDVRNLHALILKGIDDANAGKYRNVPVKISGSKFETPRPEQVGPAMTEFLDWLEQISLPALANVTAVTDPLALACAAHTWFVTIHPFIDGNGRTARLLLNLILMRYGYPIAIIRREDRLHYYDTLEAAQSWDLTPFILLVMEAVKQVLAEYLVAKSEEAQ